jgi:hypothetical protein
VRNASILLKAADVVLRYRNNRCGILVGSNQDDSAISLFAFTKEVLKYDLAGFFMRNTRKIKKSINEVLEFLLNPES